MWHVHMHGVMDSAHNYPVPSNGNRARGGGGGGRGIVILIILVIAITIGLITSAGALSNRSFSSSLSSSKLQLVLKL